MASLLTSIFWLVIPSLVLLALLPVLLKRQFSFYKALGMSTAAMLACCGVMAFLFHKAGSNSL